MWKTKKDSLWKNILLNVYNLVILTFTLVFYVTEVAFILSSQDNTNVVLQCLSWLATHTNVLLKIFIWYYNRHKLLEVIQSLDAPEFQYETSDGFDPIDVIYIKNKFNYIYLTVHFWVGQAIPVTSCLGSVASLYFEQKTQDIDEFSVGNRIFCDNLPFATYIPWNTDTNLRCILAIIFQGMGITTFGFMIISLDGMFTIIVSFVTAQFVILQGAFRSLLPRAILKVNNDENEQIDPKKLDEQVNVEMKKCVQHLQKLLSAVDDIENVYKFQNLVLVLVTLFSMCNNLYLVSATPVTSKAFIGNMAYLLGYLIELSAYCWFGNEMTTACADLPRALYESDWIQFSTKVKHSILLTMTRMVRPVTLTIGRFSPLTLNTLVSTLRGSYSFFAVLKQMNDS